MRGHIKQRSKGSWSIVLDLGRDPSTGKRKQQWVTVRCTKKEAESSSGRTSTPDGYWRIHQAVQRYRWDIFAKLANQLRQYTGPPQNV